MSEPVLDRNGAEAIERMICDRIDEPVELLAKRIADEQADRLMDISKESPTDINYNVLVHYIARALRSPDQYVCNDSLAIDNLSGDIFAETTELAEKIEHTYGYLGKAVTCEFWMFEGSFHIQYIAQVVAVVAKTARDLR